MKKTIVALMIYVAGAGGASAAEFEVHAYPSLTSTSEAKSVVDEMITKWQNHLMSKGAPVILGEWGVLDTASEAYLTAFAGYLVEQCKEAGIATFLWMKLMDGTDAAVPQWTSSDSELREAIIKAYYGPNGFQASLSSVTTDSPTNPLIYNLQGLPVKEATSPGIYIINGKKYYIK